MLNVAILMGRLTHDPELRHTGADVPVTNITLAVDRGYAKAGTERQADFIDIVAWRGTAEFICKYFRKGQMMAVEGSIQTRSYTDKDGNKRKSFEVVADEVSFTESKKDNEGGSKPAPTYAPASYTSAAPFIEVDDSNPVFGSDDYEPISLSDDDLPFM